MLGRATDQALQQPRLTRPSLHEHLPGDPPGRIAQGQGDHHHIIQGADHRQELGQQVDRGQHPQPSHHDGSLGLPGHPRVGPQPPDQGDTGREEPGQVLEQPGRETGGQQYQQPPQPDHDRGPNQDEPEPVEHRSSVL
jgi:hypothetical protein